MGSQTKFNGCQLAVGIKNFTTALYGLEEINLKMEKANKSSSIAVFPSGYDDFLETMERHYD